MKHCQNGYYNGTKFHRSIRNFMVRKFTSNLILIAVLICIIFASMFLNRYKVEILRIQEMAGNLFGTSLSKMNLNRILYIKDEVFFLWRIQEQIQMDLNCKCNKSDLMRIIDSGKIFEF
jgi:hypothetical protein